MGKWLTEFGAFESDEYPGLLDLDKTGYPKFNSLTKYQQKLLIEYTYQMDIYQAMSPAAGKTFRMIIDENTHNFPIRLEDNAEDLLASKGPFYDRKDENIEDYLSAKLSRLKTANIFSNSTQR